VSLLHWTTRRRLALLASEALEPAEQERALAHVAGCPRCAAELDALRRVIALVESDPLRTAEPMVPMELLARKTLARLDEKATASRPAPALRWLVAVPAIAAALAIALYALAPKLPPPAVAEHVAMPAETLQRLERTVAREQAARYLSEAQDVLVTVAAAPRLCDRKHKTFDLSEETRRSRELLSRRALLLDFDSAGVRSARPVLEDVERVLRQVATLDPCAHPEDVDFIHKQLREQQLLMKMGLMARELQG
jgi:hypothetical protein